MNMHSIRWLHRTGHKEYLLVIEYVVYKDVHVSAGTFIKFYF